jgi:hypothetical protein
MADFFSNADTANAYEATLGRDKVVHIPGKYSGKLSAIPPDIAEAMVAMGDNQVRRKGAAAPAVRLPAVKDPVKPAEDTSK